MAIVDAAMCAHGCVRHAGLCNTWGLSLTHRHTRGGGRKNLGTISLSLYFHSISCAIFLAALFLTLSVVRVRGGAGDRMPISAIPLDRTVDRSTQPSPMPAVATPWPLPVPSTWTLVYHSTF